MERRRAQSHATRRINDVSTIPNKTCHVVVVGIIDTGGNLKLGALNTYVMSKVKAYQQRTRYYRIDAEGTASRDS